MSVISQFNCCRNAYRKEDMSKELDEIVHKQEENDRLVTTQSNLKYLLICQSVKSPYLRAMEMC